MSIPTSRSVRYPWSRISPALPSYGIEEYMNIFTVYVFMVLKRPAYKIQRNNYWMVKDILEDFPLRTHTGINIQHIMVY